MPAGGTRLPLPWSSRTPHRLRAASALALAGCASREGTPAAAPPSRLRLLGETTLPHRMQYQGTTVGGLSAIDHDPAGGLWVALSDDRSELQPARFYTLSVDVSDRGIGVQVRGVTTLRQASGQPFPKRQAGGEVVDPEGLRLLPGGSGMLWSSEGDHPANQSPALRTDISDDWPICRPAIFTAMDSGFRR